MRWSKHFHNLVSGFAYGIFIVRKAVLYWFCTMRGHKPNTINIKAVEGRGLFMSVVWNIEVKNESFRVEGTEVFRYRIALLRFADFEEVSTFYETVGARAAAFCETTLREYAEQTFARSEQSDKRFRFSPFLYRLDGRLTYAEGDIASVMLEARCRRRGEGELCRAHTEGHTWRLSEGLLLPPAEAVALWMKGSVSRRIRRSDGVIREGERILACRKGIWSELSEEKNH